MGCVVSYSQHFTNGKKYGITVENMGIFIVLRMRLLLCGLSGFALTGCVPLAIGAAGALITTTVIEERGITGTISDSAIRSGVNTRWANAAPKLLSRVSTVVREGRVLLVGRVETQDLKKEAVRLTWNVSGVNEVLDRIVFGVAPPKTSGYVSDTWITSKINSSMLTNSRIQSINYTVKTFEGTVYIMGVARHQDELDRVVNVIRQSNGVKKVVSYVRVRDNDKSTPPKTTPPSGASRSQDGLEPVALGAEPSAVESKEH